MKATINSKGQITIPLRIRERMRLKAGDVLDFDEGAPFLKAVRVVPPEAWEAAAADWNDPWPGKSVEEVLGEIRGTVALPPEESRNHAPNSQSIQFLP